MNCHVKFRKWLTIRYSAQFGAWNTSSVEYAVARWDHLRQRRTSEGTFDVECLERM